MPTDPANLRLAQQVLDTLGIRPDALQTRAPAPTVAQYLPVVRAAATPSMLRSYGTYWTRAAEFFGNRRLDEIRPSDILALQRLVTATAHRRSSGPDGRYAGENVVRAMRTVYRLAVADGLISQEENAAACGSSCNSPGVGSRNGAALICGLGLLGGRSVNAWRAVARVGILRR